MQRLAMEFAVLPNAQGRFYYPGQGSSITAAQFRNTLRSVKSGGVSRSTASTSIPNLQAPKGNNTINVPMPAQQQASGGTSSGGGIMDTLSNAGQALNRLITQRFLTNL